MKYTGSCHCQNIKVEVNTDIKEGMVCNCSICQRRGHVLAFVPESEFKLLTDSKNLADYQWGKKSIHFYFCSTCGCAPFGKGKSPDGVMIALNLRCIDGFDIKSIKMTEFDGKNLV